MKNIYLLAIGIFCSLSSLSYGQGGINYGLKGGLNLATAQLEASGMGMTLEFDTQYRTSFYAGAFMEYSLNGFSPNLFGQIEVQYVENGFKMEESELTSEFTSKMRQLNFPFLVKYRLVQRLMVTGGFYGGFVLDVQEEDGSETYDSTQDYETFDAGFLIGAELPLNENFFVDARYNHGLVDLLALEVDGGSGNYKNRFIQVGVGYKF